MNSPAQFANQVLEKCDSTNTLARILGEDGYPHGTWVSTRVQESGRGRLGRKWASLEGNLFLSLILRIHDQKLWTWIPLAIAIGVAQVLRETDPKLEAKIKWPNDIWLRGVKAGGILCEAMGKKEEPFIIAGIGLNCLKAPEGLDQPAISLASVVKNPKILVDELRPKIIQGVLDTIRDLQAHGTKWVSDRYEALAEFPKGTFIEWNQNEGTVEGLGSSGELKVKNRDGKIVSLFAEDVKAKIKGARPASGEFPA